MLIDMHRLPVLNAVPNSRLSIAIGTRCKSNAYYATLFILECNDIEYHIDGLWYPMVVKAMKEATVPTIRYDLFMAGDLSMAKQVCREYCFHIGMCFTIEPTTYIYTGGEEEGFRIGLINYPRFPADQEKLKNTITNLAETLRTRLCQHSYTICGPDTSTWNSIREGA